MSAPQEHPFFIDTHVHLDEPAFDADRDAVLAASRRVGVRAFVNIAYKPERWESSLRLREAHPDVALVLGLHPQEAARFDRELDRSLRQAIEALRPVAVGEIGFDFARQGAPEADQRQAFRAQVRIAEDVDLPVVIHQREAADALIDELDRWPDLAPIVLHSYDGNRRLTDWAIDRGCFVGIGGLACKPASHGLRELLAEVPVDRLLLETDAPYLAPPGSKDRRNSPVNLPRIAELLAPVWHMPVEELRATTTKNAETLFGFRLGGSALD